MARLSDQRIEEFIELSVKHFGVRPSYDEARRQAEKLVRLIKVLVNAPAATGGQDH
jgi:hypothetical protein